MQNIKKMLVILIGLTIFLCGSSVYAGSLRIDIPYAINGGGWWSGLALSNIGLKTMTVYIDTVHSGSRVRVGEVFLDQRSQDVRIVPAFFTMSPYPTENDGRVSLSLTAVGDNVENGFICTFFVVNMFNSAMGFQTYDKSNGVIGIN